MSKRRVTSAKQKAASRRNLVRARASKGRSGVASAPGVPQWHRSLRKAGSGFSGARFKALQKQVRY